MHSFICSLTIIPAWTLPLNQLFAIWWSFQEFKLLYLKWRGQLCFSDSKVTLFRPNIVYHQEFLVWNWCVVVGEVYLKLDYHLPIKLFYLFQWKSFKSDENCFLFLLKSSVRSQDIYVFVLTFWSCRINGFIRKIRLASKFVTAQPG